MSAQIEMPADPQAVEEAGSALRSACGQDGAAAWRLAWRWASQAAPPDWSNEQTEALAERAMDAGGFAFEAEGAAEAPAEEKPPPASAEAPRRPQDAAEAAPSREPAQRVAPTAPPPLPAETADRLAALERAVEQVEPQVAEDAGRWDPDDEPALAGVVSAVELRDYRTRSGPVRVLTLRTAAGQLVEVQAQWKQLRALLAQAEDAEGRRLQRGDLLAIRFTGKGRPEGSRNPERLFVLRVEWGADRG